MAATKLYKGNIIGTSKEEGLFKKLSDEGTELKLLKYRDFLPGIDRAPFVTHDINTGEPTERDSWWKLYVNTSELAVQRRVEDLKRITKFIASPKGILWESERAGLEAIQRNYQKKTEDRYAQVKKGSQYRYRDSNDSAEDSGFWKSLWESIKKTGINVLKGIGDTAGLTACTLEQTGVSGTGTHVDTYISRAYLRDGAQKDGLGVLQEILGKTGFSNWGYLNAGAAAQNNSLVFSDHPWTHLENGSNLIEAGREGLVSRQDPDVGMQTGEWPGAAVERKYGSTSSPGRARAIEEVIASGDSNLIADLKAQLIRRDKLEGAKQNLTGPSAQPSSRYAKREVRSMSDIRPEDRKEDERQLMLEYGEYREQNVVYDEGTSEDTVAKEFDQAEARYILERGTGSYLGFVSNGPELKTTISGSDGKVRTVFADVPSSNLEYSRYSDSDLKLETKRQAGEGVAKKQELSFKVGYQEAKEGEITIKRSRSREENTGTFDRMQGYLYHTTDKHYSYVVDSNLEFNSDKLKDTLGLIPFCITTITPDHRTYLNFPAYLDSYDDSYNGEWESVRYVGRAENFYGYKGFTRSINLTFKVIAFRQEHLVPLYQELNRLAGVTAPSYKDALFMRGTLASITIGELLRDKLGIIPSVKFSWAVDDPWEILKDGKQKEVIQVPHVLSVSLQFNPIEKEEVREDLGSYFVFDPNPRDFTSNPEASYTEAAEGTPVGEEKQRASLKGGKVESISENRTVDTVGTSIAGGAGGHVNGPSQYDIRANDYKNRRSSPDAISGTR